MKQIKKLSCHIPQEVVDGPASASTPVSTNQLCWAVVEVHKGLFDGPFAANHPHPLEAGCGDMRSALVEMVGVRRFHDCLISKDLIILGFLSKQIWLRSADYNISHLKANI